MRKIARVFVALFCALPAFAQNETTLQIDSLSLTGMELELDQSVVVSERKYMVYKLDKKTISAATDIFAAGGTAIDILESTPSVRVDGAGEQLRGEDEDKQQRERPHKLVRAKATSAWLSPNGGRAIRRFALRTRR